MVRESLCVPMIERRQCKDINQAAYNRNNLFQLQTLVIESNFKLIIIPKF